MISQGTSSVLYWIAPSIQFCGNNHKTSFEYYPTNVQLRLKISGRKVITIISLDLKNQLRWQIPHPLSELENFFFFSDSVSVAVEFLGSTDLTSSPAKGLSPVTHWLTLTTALKFLLNRSRPTWTIIFRTWSYAWVTSALNAML